MPAKVIVGLQWGDEGKGKMADFMSDKSDMVVRYQGGANAGHTVKVGDEKFILHLLPSGVINCKGYCILGAGMVISPQGLVHEIETLKAQGVNIKIKIDLKAHILMPYHILLDELEEIKRAGSKLGTTKRGIGPCYEDKYARRGLRFGDLLDMNKFKTKLELAVNEKNSILHNIYGHKMYDHIDLLNQIIELMQKENLQSMIADTTYLINDALDSGKNVLFEGAQAIMLDIDHGSYPFVTSSSAFAGGVFAGAGIAHQRLTSVMGVAKAYSTRVGTGVFPTEVHDLVAERLRDLGAEFGATTGRPRRVGHIDLPQLKYSVMLNGVTELVITKIDVLSDYDEIKVGVAYKIDGQETTKMPSNLQDYEGHVEVVYKTFKGWKSDITGIRNFKDLPKECQTYVNFIQEYLNIRVVAISVGPKRDQNIFLTDIKF